MKIWLYLSLTPELTSASQILPNICLGLPARKDGKTTAWPGQDGIIGYPRRVNGDLAFADAVAGENGAVITFPRSGHSTALHRPPPPAFLDGLKKLGVGFKTGETVVEADASGAPIALEIIRLAERLTPHVRHRTDMGARARL